MEKERVARQLFGNGPEKYIRYRTAKDNDKMHTIVENIAQVGGLVVSRYASNGVSGGVDSFIC